MSDKVHCGNCKWTMKQKLTGPGGAIQIGKEILTCHRFPPSAVMVPTGGNPLGAQAYALMSNFPPVDGTMVCSLHEFADPDGAVLTSDVPGLLSKD